MCSRILSLKIPLINAYYFRIWHCTTDFGTS
jgi:hypothetical protein